MSGKPKLDAKSMAIGLVLVGGLLVANHFGLLNSGKAEEPGGVVATPPAGPRTEAPRTPKKIEPAGLPAGRSTGPSGSAAKTPEGTARAPQSTLEGVGDRLIQEAFEHQREGVMVQTAGVVTRLLDDDEEGSRHQRFVLRLGSGRTILIAHNIDLAERVPARLGDRVEFKGQYEWNHNGGVVHWTHRDPKGRHPDGWLRHKDKTYK